MSSYDPYPHEPWVFVDPGPYPHDENGNPIPGKEPPKNSDCAACKEDIPLKWSNGEWIHLDLFATPEAGVIYPCPVSEGTVDDES